LFIFLLDLLDFFLEFFLFLGVDRSLIYYRRTEVTVFKVDLAYIKKVLLVASECVSCNDVGRLARAAIQYLVLCCNQHAAAGFVADIAALRSCLCHLPMSIYILKRHFYLDKGVI
jgi:hypothetical protein